MKAMTVPNWTMSGPPTSQNPNLIKDLMLEPVASCLTIPDTPKGLMFVHLMVQAVFVAHCTKNKVLMLWLMWQACIFKSHFMSCNHTTFNSILNK